MKKVSVLFPTAFRYPSLPAEWRFGLEQARGFVKVLGSGFLYIVERVDDPVMLAGVPYRETRAGTRFSLRRWHILSLYYLLWLFWFFFRNPQWRGRDAVIYITERKIGLGVLLLRLVFGFGYAVIFESHSLEEPWLDRFLYRYSDHIIFVTNAMREIAIRDGLIAEEKPVSVMPAAVNMGKFAPIDRDPGRLRQELSLPQDKKIVLYAGRFRAMGSDKGIAPLIEIAGMMSSEEVIFCFVGGTEKEIAAAREAGQAARAEARCIFVPFVDEHAILKYLLAADALIYLPPREKFFLYETSPMKLFEYMAAGRPIVLADYPALREALDGHEAFFVDPGNSSSVRDAIRRAVSGDDAVVSAAHAAYARAAGNTWDIRAQKILDIAQNI